MRKKEEILSRIKKEERKKERKKNKKKKERKEERKKERKKERKTSALPSPLPFYFSDITSPFLLGDRTFLTLVSFSLSYLFSLVEHIGKGGSKPTAQVRSRGRTCSSLPGLQRKATKI